MRFIVLVIVGLAGILAACSSTGAIRSQWEHRVLASGERTSREYREEGLLLYRERLVPPAFTSILCPAGSFVYHRPHALVAASSGWLREDANLDSLEVRSGAVSLADKDRQRGWYLAAWDGKRAGTPSDWVWVRIGTNGYWLKPQGLHYYSELLAPPRDGQR